MAQMTIWARDESPSLPRMLWTCVSTTCVSEGPRCVGTRYDFNPIVGAQIVLSAAPEVGVASVPLSAPQQVRCKQRRPNRNHHCTLVFPNLETTIGDPSTLPCPPTDCYVNLLVGASNPAISSESCSTAASLLRAWR